MSLLLFYVGGWKKNLFRFGQITTCLSCLQVRRLCGRLAMRTWPFRLLPLLFIFLLAHAQVPLKKNLTIGYLTAIKGDLRDRQGLTASGAVQMAVDEVRGVTTPMFFLLSPASCAVFFCTVYLDLQFSHIISCFSPLAAAHISSNHQLLTTLLHFLD